MIGALVFTNLFTAIMTGVLTYLWVRRPRPPVPLRYRRLMADAMAFILQVHNPTSLDLQQVDLLSDSSKETAAKLLDRYDKEVTSQ